MITRKLSLILLSAVISGSTAFSQVRLAVNGTSPTTSGTVYLQKFNNKMFATIDSAKLSDGKFAFHTKVVLPELYGITFDKNASPYFLFLDNERVEIALDSAKRYANTTVKGSAAQEVFAAYKKQRSVKIDEFIRNNPASIVSAYVLYRDFSYRLSPEEIESNVALLDKSFQSTQYVKVLNELKTVLRRVAIGNKAIDFTSIDPSGKQVKLSDQFGKYILLDFWAAWCGPCRQENPNVVKAFQKYKDLGFTVVGVSLDKSKEAWVKAIKDDNLTWTHVSDLAYWNSAAASLYGIRAIPGNFLLAPDGTIVARNLRGVALDQKLDELLNKKTTSTTPLTNSGK